MRAPKRSVAPALARNGAACCFARPSTVNSNSAPVTARTRSSSNSSSGPSSVTSSVAASAWFPTIAFARRGEQGSIGPATGTPRDWSPHRPRSWIVVNIPALITRTAMSVVLAVPGAVVLRAIDRIELHGVARLQEKRFGPGGIERLHWRAANQLPASRRLGRIDAGLHAGNPDRSERDAHARARVARHGNPGVHDAHVRKARDKPEHEDAIRPAGVQSHHFVGGQLRARRDRLEIRPEIAAVAHRDPNGRAPSRGIRRRLRGLAFDQHVERPVVRPERIEVDRDRAIGWHDISYAWQAGSLDGVSHGDRPGIDGRIDSLVELDDQHRIASGDDARVRHASARRSFWWMPPK